MKLKKLTLLTIISLAVAGTLVACGQTEKEADTSGRTPLTIATWANETEAKEFEDIIASLNENQDQYELTQMVIPSDYYTKIQTMIAGGQAPDLMWLAQEYISAYATNNAIVDLTEGLAAQNQIDMDDFLEGSLNTAMYQGNTYGLPWIGQPFVVYYNKTMFEEQGIDLPTLDWTWNDFKETAKSLTGDDVFGFGTTGNPPLAVFAWGEGGELIDVDRQVLLDSEATVRGLEVANSIINDPEVTMPHAEIQSMGTEQAFLNGAIGMMVGGANDDVERKVEEAGSEFEVGMAIMPSGSEQHVTFNWTASTVISSQTANEEVAMQALLDLTEAMFDWKVPAPVKSKIENITEINPSKAYAIDTILKSAEISRGFNNMPEQNELGTIQWEQLDSIILTNNNGNGNLDLGELARDVAQRFRNILE